MEMKSKNMFILIVAFLLLIILTASTSALIMSGIEEDPIEVCVVIDNSSSGRWSSFTAGLEQAAKDKGVRLDIIPTNGSSSIGQQYILMKEAVNNGTDGVILQAVSSRGTETMISDISSKAVLVLVDSDVEKDVDVEGKSACIMADNNEIGKALANEIRIALGNDLGEYTIGIVAGNQRQNSTRMRLEGFIENIESSNAQILWTDYGVTDLVGRIEKRQEDDKAQILVALDNDGLEAVCEYALKHEENPYIFGEGTSIKNVSYLDDGLINSMVVPNEYYMGYQSVAAIVKRMENRITPMEDEEISFRIINRESLFDVTNQRLLFPVVE